VRVAYLINQYPKTSHTFVRREIEALERCGVDVLRYAIRPLLEPLVDPDDRDEQRRTRTLLAEGRVALLRAALVVAATRPLAFARALALGLRLGWRSERGLLRHLAYLCEACLLLRHVVASQVSHLHAHFGTNSAAVAMLCRALGGPPYSFTAHGTESFAAPGRIGLSLKIARALFVVAVSEDGRARLLQSSPDPGTANIHLVHCGVDHRFLDVDESPVPAAPRLSCIARFSAEKGLAVLLKAAAELAAEGRVFELAIIGDGELRPDIERGVARLGLLGHVRLLGWRSGAEVRAHLLASRALVLPSVAEGLPVVLAESLALARPVIASSVGGIPELVESGVDGWLVPPFSSTRLAQAMRVVLDTRPEDLTRMGHAGRERVRARHDVAMAATQLARLFGNTTALTSPMHRS
jgi:glycosyltransferase involved in cell wall biosynthesis